MATTINAANISIGMDLTKLKNGMGASRTEISQLRSILKDSIDPVDKLKHQMTLLERAFKSGAIDVDQYARSMDHLKKKIAEVNQQASGGGIQGLLKGKLGQLAGMAAGAFTISSIVGTAKEFDDIIDKSEQLGVSYRDLMVIGRTLEESGGISFEQSGQAISKMQLNLANARDKGGDLDKMLKSIGLSSRNLASMDAVSAFKQIQTAFSKIEGHANKTQFAVELFGKAGIDMVPALETAASQFDQMEKHLMQAGLLAPGMEGKISEAADSAARLKDIFQGFALLVAAEFGPTLTKILGDLKTSMEGYANLKKVIQGVKSEGDSIDKALGITYDSAMLERMTKAERDAFEDAAARRRVEFMQRKKAEDELAEQRKKAEQEMQKLQKDSLDRMDEFSERIKKRVADQRREADAQADSTLKNLKQQMEAAKERVDIERKIAEMKSTSGTATDADKRIDIERRVSQMRSEGILATDAQRRKQAEDEIAIKEQAIEKRAELDVQISKARDAEAQRMKFEKARILATRDKESQEAKDLIAQAEKESAKRLEEINSAATFLSEQIESDSQLAKIDKQASALEAERQRIMGTTGPNVAATIAPAIRAGTVEAYKAVNQQNEQRVARQEQIQRLDAIKDEIRKLNESKAIVLKKAR